MADVFGAVFVDFLLELWAGGLSVLELTREGQTLGPQFFVSNFLEEMLDFVGKVIKACNIVQG